MTIEAELLERIDLSIHKPEIINIDLNLLNGPPDKSVEPLGTTANVRG